MWPSSRWPSRASTTCVVDDGHHSGGFAGHQQARSVTVGVLEFWQLSRVAATRRVVEARRHLLADAFVRAVVVELIAERIECELLLLAVRLRWTSSLRFEGAMHAFVAPILPRRRRRDALRRDPEPNPPHAQGRQPGGCVCGEGRSIVAANRGRQAVLDEGCLEAGARTGSKRRRTLSGRATSTFFCWPSGERPAIADCSARNQWSGGRGRDRVDVSKQLGLSGTLPVRRVRELPGLYH